MPNLNKWSCNVQLFLFHRYTSTYLRCIEKNVSYLIAKTFKNTVVFNLYWFSNIPETIIYSDSIIYHLCIYAIIDHFRIENLKNTFIFFFFFCTWLIEICIGTDIILLFYRYDSVDHFVSIYTPIYFNIIPLNYIILFSRAIVNSPRNDQLQKRSIVNSAQKKKLYY